MFGVGIVELEAHTLPMKAEVCILQVEVGEVYKGSVHLTLFGLLVVCAAYNLGALMVRPTARLVGQTLLYGGLAVHEARQVRGHWQK